MGRDLNSRLRTAGLLLLGIAAFLIVAFLLEDEAGLPFDTSYRIACAAICLFFIYKLGASYPGEGKKAQSRVGPGRPEQAAVRERQWVVSFCS